MTPTAPAFLYARVSTEDKDQNPESQLVALREWAARQKMTVFGEAWDKVTGRTALDEREAGERVMGWIREGSVGLLVTFSASRLSRAEPEEAWAVVCRIKAMGGNWCSATEPHLDTRMYEPGTRQWHHFRLLFFLAIWTAHDVVLAISEATHSGLRRICKERGVANRGQGRHKHACGLPRGKTCPCGCQKRGPVKCATGVHTSRKLAIARKRRRHIRRSRITLALEVPKDALPDLHKADARPVKVARHEEP